MSSEPGSIPPTGNVAGLLLKFRQAAGMAQTELAERAKVSRSRIIAAEAGDSLPTMDISLKLARALAIPPAMMIRAHVKDSVGEADPSVLAELGPEFLDGRSQWDLIAKHHGLRIEHGHLHATVNAKGDIQLVRRYVGCVATRPRKRIVFRDRIVGERPPAFAVKGSPRGLGFNMNVSIEGEWAQHRVEFHKPWTPEDGAFEFEFESTLPHAFVLDREAEIRRRVAEGLKPRESEHGDFRSIIAYCFEKFEFGMSFPLSYCPPWQQPTAVWGNAPIDDADYQEIDETTCRSSTFEAAGHRGSLLLNRPLPGYTFGLRWKPIDWEPNEGDSK